MDEVIADRKGVYVAVERQRLAATSFQVIQFIAADVMWLSEAGAWVP